MHVLSPALPASTSAIAARAMEAGCDGAGPAASPVPCVDADA